jgi:hypothetical protein
MIGNDMKKITTEDTEDTKRENDLQCELAAWELLREAKRERDEVRELHMNTLRERDKWEETARLYCQNSDYHREMREKAERERDEARHKLELCMAANSDVARIAKERDEARQQNAKLRDIAEMAITAVVLWAGSRTNSASKLRAELDKLKEGAK